MNKHALKLLLLFIISQAAVAKTIPSYVPQTGLKVWLPFNGNSNDESSNGNTAIINKAQPTTDRNGNPNSAYSFSGLNHQYIMYSSSVLPSGNGSRTVSMWLYYGGAVAAGESLTALGYGEQDIGKGHMVGYYMGTARNMSWGDDHDEYVTYNDSKWHHLVTTYNGSTSQIYFDGILVGTMSKSWNTTAANKFFVGTRMDSLNSFFNGKIDDIGIWNRVLTAAEVSALYTGSTGPSLPSYLPKANLLAWYPFNGNAVDESGNGNNPIVNTASLTSDRKSTANSAYDFNGATGNYIKCTNVNMPTGSSARTISLWVNLKGVLTSLETLTAFGYGAQSTGNCQMVGLWENKLRYASWGYDLDIPYTYSTNTWYHMLVTYDGTTAKIYLNGVLKGSNAMSWNTLSSTILTIGTRPDFANSFFNGKIDDIGVWGRVLTATEINDLYTAGGATALNETEPVSKLAFTVYPNPVHSQLKIYTTLQGNLGNVEIYDLKGELVKQIENYYSENEIPVSDLPNGLYFVKLKDYPELVQKIVIE